MAEGPSSGANLPGCDFPHAAASPWWEWKSTCLFWHSGQPGLSVAHGEVTEWGQMWVPGTTARLFLYCGDPPGAGLWLRQGKACLSICGRLGWTRRAELGRRACVHPKGARHGPDCPQQQLVLSKDAGSGLASSNLPPHLSVIKISVLNLQ